MQFDPTFFVWAKKSKINTAVLIDHRQAKMDIPQNRGGMHYQPPVPSGDASQA